MDRRDFLNASALTAMATLFETEMEAVVSPHTGTENKIKDTFLLTSRLDPERVVRLYEGASGVEASGIPYLYLHYDEGKNTFVNPRMITPRLKPGTYTLESKLFAFNVSFEDYRRFENLKNEVQLGFNATAPLTDSDSLTWLFMNAIDVFLVKPADRPKQLSNFTKDGKGTALQANPKVTVAKGLIDLQVTAFGQKKDGFWKKFFNVLTAVVSSPILSDVSKGFVIPGLATDALKFVNHAVNVFAEKEKLQEIWKTSSLSFGIHEGAEARFKMNPGLWVMIDSDYARETNLLEGHRIDLDYQSFRITNKDNKVIDTNYLVSDLRFKE